MVAVNCVWKRTLRQSGAAASAAAAGPRARVLYDNIILLLLLQRCDTPRAAADIENRTRYTSYYTQYYGCVRTR